MEYWEQLLFWLVLSTAGASLFYYICFKVFGKAILTAPSRPVSLTPVPIGRFRSTRGQVSCEERERLVYEEYRSEVNGESVAVVQHDKSTGKMVAICAFQNELRVEYFVEDFSKCCLEKCNSLSLRALLGTISHWSERWAGSEVVHVLSPDRNVVVQANTRDSIVHKTIGRLEEKFAFKVSVQYTGNFLCHDADHEELWDELISMSLRLLRDGDDRAEWTEFPVEHWERTRTKLEHRGRSLHLIPHSGDIDDGGGGGGQQQRKEEEEQLISLAD